MINNIGTPSSEVQINFGVLQINSENSATGITGRQRHTHTDWPTAKNAIFGFKGP